MIQNFDEVRTQLKELAVVLNSYKSEAVQLRLLELIFAGATPKGATGGAPGSGGVLPADPARDSTPARAAARKRPRRKAKAAAEGEPGNGAKPRNSPSRNGPRSTLTAVYDDGFFKKPRTIGQLVEHCDHDLALKFKSSDFSGPLARYTREKRLKRVKNAEGQYEYTQGA